MCRPGSCESGPVDGVVVVNPLTVCVFTSSLDECPNPLSRFEGVVWSSVLHVCRHGSSPV